MNPSHIALVDYFAGLAMQAILKSAYDDGVYVGDQDNDSQSEIAHSAYAQAFAMLEIREQILSKLILEQADESSIN
jgi:hypothetical protein